MSYAGKNVYSSGGGLEHFTHRTSVLVSMSYSDTLWQVLYLRMTWPIHARFQAIQQNREAWVAHSDSLRFAVGSLHVRQQLCERLGQAYRTDDKTEKGRAVVPAAAARLVNCVVTLYHSLTCSQTTGQGENSIRRCGIDRADYCC